MRETYAILYTIPSIPTKQQSLVLQVKRSARGKLWGSGNLRFMYEDVKKTRYLETLETYGRPSSIVPSFPNTFERRKLYNYISFFPRECCSFHSWDAVSERRTDYSNRNSSYLTVFSPYDNIVHISQAAMASLFRLHVSMLFETGFMLATLSRSPEHANGRCQSVFKLRCSHYLHVNTCSIAGYRLWLLGSLKHNNVAEFENTIPTSLPLRQSNSSPDTRHDEPLLHSSAPTIYAHQSNLVDFRFLMRTAGTAGRNNIRFQNYSDTVLVAKTSLFQASPVKSPWLLRLFFQPLSSTPSQVFTPFLLFSSFIFNMQFTTVIAVILSMAAFGIAAPTPVAEDVVGRQNHGMCVASTDGTPCPGMKGGSRGVVHNLYCNQYTDLNIGNRKWRQLFAYGHMGTTNGIIAAIECVVDDASYDKYGTNQGITAYARPLLTLEQMCCAQTIRSGRCGKEGMRYVIASTKQTPTEGDLIVCLDNVPIIRTTIPYSINIPSSHPFWKKMNTLRILLRKEVVPVFREYPLGSI
ncbi:uncharacterized protein BDR25DRAFT_393905 [Lindgomyces ingoldianus]|uniref:Uncharacterized protein n=1 Tax=Lindgomyces ingoldianus TaxID=673940 RepID=A0ACB6QTR8_9PLEO|nr:uncharacterized protein BDR25DRAFT_393905 [Lindgomyces ingoldianus]KAF2470403.1 hypothetical protein BDR25DRAFT_393905 [Lindgomyces ingoldianus]